MYLYKYVSRAKIREIEAGIPRRRVTSVRGDLSIPVLGQISIEYRPRAFDLEAVIDHIAPEVTWYEDGGFRAGEWIDFEVPLIHTCREIKGKAVVIYLDRPGDGRRRLLLHGSADSLVGVHTVTTAEQTPHDPEASSSRIIPAMLRRDRSEDVEVIDLFRQLDFALDPATAIQMRGFAQVTMDAHGRMPLIASPLFVACSIGGQ